MSSEALTEEMGRIGVALDEVWIETAAAAAIGAGLSNAMGASSPAGGRLLITGGAGVGKSAALRRRVDADPPLAAADGLDAPVVVVDAGGARTAAAAADLLLAALHPRRSPRDIDAGLRRLSSRLEACGTRLVAFDGVGPLSRGGGGEVSRLLDGIEGPAVALVAQTDFRSGPLVDDLPS